jgi:hypothetical protein
MARRTLGGGLQVNLTINEEAWQLLQHYAPTRKSYGRFISDLILNYDEQYERDELRARVERLEAHIAGNSLKNT